jgi:hypothetical protein
MQGELAVGATVSRRHRRRFLRCCKAGAGASNTRLGRLVFGLRESRAEPPADFLRACSRRFVARTVSRSKRRFVGHEGLCSFSAAIAVRQRAAARRPARLRVLGARPVLASCDLARVLL